MHEYLGVGSGLYGDIVAHEGKAHGKSVLVVDKCPNIADNIYTKNINEHKYGVNILASRNRDSGAVETYIPDTETAFDWLNYHS